MDVVICGGGAIGTSIAYFLSLRGIAATVIESCGVANAASGKSGGFLALDWCEGTKVAPLARRGFDLHAELADSLGGDWGYRRMETLGLIASERRDVGAFHQAESPAWVDPAVAVHGRLGTPDTTAQIDPAAYTQAMMDAAAAGGARLLEAKVTGLTFSGNGRAVAGVVTDTGEIPADTVIIAMGPWSILAAQWLPLPPTYGLKGHSFVFGGTEPIPPQALFVEFETGDGQVHSPEFVPRADGTAYVCGVSSQNALPLDPAAVQGDAGAHETLLTMVQRVSPVLGSAEVLRMQACFRPVTQDGLPMIGHIPGVHGAYVATGHSVWGMLNAPSTGEAVAELIADGEARTVNLAAFNPGRMMPMNPNVLGAGR